MTKYAMLLEYNGSSFHGWQAQPQVNTVQVCLESALSAFAAEPIVTIAAGRTDAGVHALGQVVHFTSEANRPLSAWQTAVNSYLPISIRIKEVTIVSSAFDARFSAIQRTYCYYLQLGKVRTAIFDKLIGYCYYPLDIALMQQACKMLLGKHDFSAMRAAACQAHNPVREVFICHLQQRNNLLRLTITANAFLQQMIRNIMGALLAIGSYRLTLTDFAVILASKNRILAPATFMADGLYLTNITYAEPIFHTDSQHISWLFDY